MINFISSKIEMAISIQIEVKWRASKIKKIKRWQLRGQEKEQKDNRKGGKLYGGKTNEQVLVKTWSTDNGHFCLILIEVCLSLLYSQIMTTFVFNLHVSFASLIICFIICACEVC